MGKVEQKYIPLYSNRMFAQIPQLQSIAADTLNDPNAFLAGIHELHGS